MREKIKGFWNKILEKWKTIGKKIKIAIGVVLLVAVAAIVLVLSMSGNQTYVTLFTGLSKSDMTDIVTYLGEQGITDYQIEGEDTILVPKEQEAVLKAKVIQSGHLNSGFGYDTYFDNVNALTTESERNTLERFEIQDRTAAVIRQFVGVKDAFVEISPSQDTSFILDSDSMIPATAHVQVIMEEGYTVGDNLAQSIRTLISHAHQGLDISNVSISDAYGNLYSDDDGFGDLQDMSALKQKLEEQTNNQIRTEVMQVLMPLYGMENVRVAVNSIVDVDRRYTDSTDYSLEEGATEGIIGSIIYDQQIIRGEDAENAGGVVGTGENSDFNTYVETPLETDGNETLVSSSGQQDHLVDTDKTQIEHLAGTVVDVMVSVTINQEVAGGTNLEDLYPHVARAAGITTADQNEKVSILVGPFYQPTAENGVPALDGAVIPMWAIYAAIAGLAVFLILLVVILLIRRKIRKKKQKQLEEEQQAQQEAAIQEALAGAAAAAAAKAQVDGDGVDIMAMDTDKSIELRKQVRRFAEQHPELAAQMIRQLLREE